MPADLAAEGVNYAPQIVAAAQKHGIDPTLLAAVAAQETGGPGANGGANIIGDGGHGHGLFQIDDRWHDFAGTPAAMDPVQNADYAVGMIAGNLKRFGGDVHKALSAYNAGSPDATGTKTTWGDGRTLGYADSVLRHEAQLEGKGDPLEEARAEAPSQSEALSALQNVALAFAPAPACAPALPALPAQPSFTTRQTTDYDSYINGNDDGGNS